MKFAAAIKRFICGVRDFRLLLRYGVRLRIRLILVRN
ncbi:hypothetical protein IMSAGC016_01303 [Muribaculaceae bacterium]|nr:hypothetical protein IMSAGC016_01303 [Muribaculaceae bacterium]